MDGWSCEFCPGRVFATEGGLAAHLKSVHADEDKDNSRVSAMKPEQKD